LVNEVPINKIDETLERLKQQVKLRDQMCGVLYYNVLNDECCHLANKCIELGIDRAVVESILGPGTFYY